jgi:hypothetical protein
VTRSPYALLLALPLLLGTACGGGGGGSSGGGTPCVKPGTLREIALQGQAAPGTGGIYQAFGAGMLMDCAQDGWSVFVAGTTDGANAQCLFVVEPSGNVLKAFATGEVVPNAGGGTISGYQLARVNGSGQILTEVSITGDGGGRTFGLLTAQVIGGAVTNKTALVYHQQDMTATGVDGTFLDLDESRVWFLDDGRTFFGGTTNDPAEALWIVNIDGGSLECLLATGDALPDLGSPNVACLDIEAVGIDQLGNRYAFVADVGGMFEERLYIGSTTVSGYAEVASDGNALPAGGREGNILECHAGGPLLLYNDGNVVWKALGTETVPDDVILSGNAVAPYFELARSGYLAPGASGGGFGDLDLLNHRQEPEFPQMMCELINVPGGADFATYAFTGSGPLLSIFEGRAVPADFAASTSFTDQLPGLRAAQTFDVARDGSFAFAAATQNGSNGMFWLVPGCGTFTLAKVGTTTPGGDTFGAFAPQATHTCHDGVVLFRALLTTAGSGVFRQGP